MPLHGAAANGNTECCLLLLHLGADQMAECRGETALQMTKESDARGAKQCKELLRLYGRCDTKLLALWSRSPAGAKYQVPHPNVPARQTVGSVLKFLKRRAQSLVYRSHYLAHCRCLGCQMTTPTNVSKAAIRFRSFRVVITAVVVEVSSARSAQRPDCRLQRQTQVA